MPLISLLSKSQVPTGLLCFLCDQCVELIKKFSMRNNVPAKLENEKEWLMGFRYYSMYGHVEKMAEEICKGANSVNEVEATMWQVCPSSFLISSNMVSKHHFLSTIRNTNLHREMKQTSAARLTNKRLVT